MQISETTKSYSHSACASIMITENRKDATKMSHLNTRTLAIRKTCRTDVDAHRFAGLTLSSASQQR